MTARPLRLASAGGVYHITARGNARKAIVQDDDDRAGFVDTLTAMVVLAHDKTRLAEIRAAAREQLATERLCLHPCKAHISPVADGLNLLGYLVYPTRRRLRSDNGHRFVRKLRNMAKAYRAGRMDWPHVVSSVQSWIGHAQHADTDGLRRAIFSQVVFRRGMGQGTASA